MCASADSGSLNCGDRFTKSFHIQTSHLLSAGRGRRRNMRISLGTCCIVLGILLAAALTACGGGTSDTTPISLITPYRNSTDMLCVHQAFSLSASAPWGFEHHGIDIMLNGNLKPFQAVCSGVVSRLELWGNATSDQHVEVEIKYNDTYTVMYLFEPAPPRATRSDAEIQLANIRVSLGQFVSQGDIIGNLYAASDTPIVHFGLLEDGVWICPEPYFTSEARDSILALLHVRYPGANMCY